VTVIVSNTSASSCATLPVPVAQTVFPGSTTFNNTVIAQMWFADNTWWAAFSDASSGIYFYRRSGSSFVKGALIDRNFLAGKPDTLWNGRELFILVYRSGSLAALYKYTYAAATQTYALVPGFPVGLPLAGLATSIALQQDSTGQLWATYTSDRDVHVIWSTSPDHTLWDTTGVILASDVDDATPEAATITPFGLDKIGVVWSNQALGEIGFRFHRDGDAETSWSPKELVDCCEGIPGVADDQLALRAAPDGRLFLVAKDGILTGRIHAYVRSAAGTWGPKTTIHPDPAAQPTRPVLALDVEHDHAYVIFHESLSRATYFSRTSMTSPTFAGPCPFTDQGNNVTTTKQNVNGTTDLVAAASRAGLIYSAVIDLGSGSARAPLDRPSASVAAATAPPPATQSRLRARGFLVAASLLSSLLSGFIDADATPVPAALNGDGPSGVTAAVVPASLGDEAPVADFEVIWDGELSTSRLPAHDSQWQWLRARGVASIVHLDDRMIDVAQYGIGSFLWVRPGSAGVPTYEDAERFLTFIQLADNQPAHMSSVVSNRRGTLVALLRYAIEGWTIEQALAEGQRLAGGAGLTPQQVGWLLGWAQSHPPGSHRRVVSTLSSTLSGTMSVSSKLSTVADFEVIWDGKLSISKTPANDGQWLWVRARSVNSIVNLDDRMIDVAQYGFASFLLVPAASGGVPTYQDAERFLTFIQVADNQPVHVTSVARDRRATMVALLRYAIEGWTIQQALAEAQRLASGSGLTARQIEWLLGWAKSHPPGSALRVASTLSSTLSETTSTVASALAPVAEFEAIWDGQLSTSRMPAHDDQWLWLRARGVTSVVNLDDQMIDVAQYGFESFLWVRPGKAGVPTYEDAERFLMFIQLADNRPVHMSSVLRNRRATMVALLRYAIEGWTIDRALAEAQRLDGGPGLTPHQIEWLLGWARSHPPGSHPRMASAERSSV
jgi:hypothetical protein